MMRIFYVICIGVLFALNCVAQQLPAELQQHIIPDLIIGEKISHQKRVYPVDSFPIGRALKERLRIFNIQYIYRYDDEFKPADNFPITLISLDSNQGVAAIHLIIPYSEDLLAKVVGCYGPYDSVTSNPQIDNNNHDLRYEKSYFWHNDICLSFVSFNTEGLREKDLSLADHIVVLTYSNCNPESYIKTPRVH